jgi:hypothetical protein
MPTAAALLSFHRYPPVFFANVMQTVISFGRSEEGGFSPMGCAKLLIGVWARACI